MVAQEQIPSGWYPDPDDGGVSERYWDGEDWTETTRPARRPRPTPAQQTAAPQTQAQPGFGQPYDSNRYGEQWSSAQYQNQQAQPQQYGQPPAPQYQGQRQWQGHEVAQAKNGFGLVALVLGILGSIFGLIPILFVLAFPLGVLAVVRGALGRRRFAGGVATNKGLATSGLVLGVIALVLGLIGALIVDDAFNDLEDAFNGPEFSSSAPADPGSTGSGDEGVAPTNVPLGQSVTSNDESSSLQITAQSQRRSGETLSVLVVYDCTSGSCAYNPFDWKLRAPDGTEYDYAPTFDSGLAPTLSSGNLNAGQKARGYVEFQAPRGAYSLEYGGYLFSSSRPTWALP